jgi:hypothetical protein
MKLRLLVQVGDDGEFPLCIFIFFDSGIFVMFGLRLIYGFYPLSNEKKKLSKLILENDLNLLLIKQIHPFT